MKATSKLAALRSKLAQGEDVTQEKASTSFMMFALKSFDSQVSSLNTTTVKYDHVPLKGYCKLPNDRIWSSFHSFFGGPKTSNLSIMMI
jgi:hypothetical protein